MVGIKGGQSTGSILQKQKCSGRSEIKRESKKRRSGSNRSKMLQLTVKILSSFQNAGLKGVKNKKRRDGDMA